MSGVYDGALEDLLDRPETGFAGPRGPGVVVGIVADGGLRGVAARGLANLDHGIPVDRTTVFHIASVSKQFTAFAVATLADQGRLRLDDPVVDHLDWFPFREVRIEHLVQHTSGLRDEWSLSVVGGGRVDDVISVVARHRGLDFAPGTQWSYCNTGYTLLALIVEAVTGMTLRGYCAKTFFEPLGMDRTAFMDDCQEVIPGRADSYWRRPRGDYGRVEQPYSTVGASGVVTTVEDLARWAVYTMRPESRALLERPATLTDGTALSYATGVAVTEYRGHRSVSHSGVTAGYRAHLRVLPERNLAAIVLSNFAGLVTPALGQRVLDVALPPATPAQPVASGVEPDTLAGRYLDDDGDSVLDLRVEDGTLVLRGYPGDLARPLSPRPGGRFADVEDDIVVEPAPGGIRVILSEGPPRFCRRLPESAGITGSGYGGTFRSRELDAILHVEMSGDGLRLRQSRGPVDLTPVDTDIFLAAVDALAGMSRMHLVVRFAADRSQLWIGNPWARRVHFERLPD